MDINDFVPVLAILKLQHEKVRISENNKLMSKISFVPSTSTLRNGLPPVITCLSTFNTFKKYLKTYIFS